MKNNETMLDKFAIIWKKKKYTFWAWGKQQALEIAIQFNFENQSNGILMVFEQSEILENFRKYKEVRIVI